VCQKLIVGMKWFAFTSVAVSALSSERNDWPIIGMFTQPSTSSRAECGGSCLYLAASYVKQIESAGARVVPINYYATEVSIISSNINFLLSYTIGTT
jgi:hypothetical protein